MFGYVKAYNPELKMAEFETYKAVYCSLCRDLGKKYGLAAKMTLSYDFTFMVLLRLSVNDKFCGYSTMHCVFNPLKKCSCLGESTEEMEYTAAASVILFYYKLKDNIADSGFLGKLGAYLLLPFASRGRKKAMKNYPDIDIAALKYITAQAQVESAHEKSLDKSSEPSAVFLSEIFARKSDSENDYRILQQIGMNLGRWIYIADALDDLRDDIKSGDYNPIATRYSLYGNVDNTQIETAKDSAKGTLNLYNAALCDAINLLDAKRFGTILKNIAQLGLKNVADTLGKSKDERKKHKNKQKLLNDDRTTAKN